MPNSKTMVNLHPPAASEPSSPSSMNEGDRRLLLLAAVSQREQRVSSTPDHKGSSHLISKDLPCITDLTAADAVSENTAIRETGTVAPPFKKRGISSESITTTDSTVDPTTFTLDKNEDIMIQLHRNGLDQVKIPPLYTSEVPLPPVTHKRQVSEGTRDATSCGGHFDTSSGASSQGSPQANDKRGASFFPKIVTGGSSPRSTRQRQVVMPASTTSSSLSTFPAPPLGRNVCGSQDNNLVGGSAASMQKWGHDYHQQIMSMSMNGLSSQKQMLLMRAGPQGRLNDGMHPALYCNEIKDEGRLNPLRQPQKQPQKVILTDQGPLKNPKKDATSWSSKSNAGLSAPHSPNHAFYNMMSGAPQQQMMRHQPKEEEMQTLIVPQESEGPLQKRRKKNDTTSRATRAQEASKHITKNNGKPIVFPNQEIYSEIARKRKKDSVSKSKHKSPSQATEALAAKMVVPFYNNWRKEQAEGARRAASATSSHKKGTVAASMSAAAAPPPPPLSTSNPPLSVQKAEPGFMYQDQEESIMIQHRLLQIERAFQHEQKQKQLQRYLQLQQQQQSRTQDMSWEQISSSDNSHLRIMAHQQEPTLLSQDDPNVQVRLSLLELENQVRAEEHDRSLQTNQRQMSELHQHAIQLEERMKLREMDFIKERKRLVDLQTVNRLRLQADELEKQLMMKYGQRCESFRNDRVSSS